MLGEALGRRDRPVAAAPTQWPPLYGMLRDRFAITWVMDVLSEYARPDHR